jgi:hypothetical protein
LSAPGENVLEPARPNDETAALPWRASTRVAFRFTFCYLTQYALGCGNATPWRALPWLGKHLFEPLCAAPYLLAAQWMGTHVFHLQGPAAHLHTTSYSDRALDWIAAGLMLAIAAAATAIWSALDRNRREYRTLLAWFRFGLRLTLAVAMLNYGSWKIFPIQMPPPSLAVLNEPLGQTSPLTLLWTLLGLNPLYENICGGIEFLGALLLLTRRTALVGALLAAFVMINVVLFNCFFDVPVKLYAANLLLMALVAIVPDLRALWGFFWRQTPSAPTSLWQPALRGRVRWLLPALELLVLLTVGIVASSAHYRQHALEEASLRHPSPLSGEWHLDAGTLLTGDGVPMSDLVLEPDGRVNVRAADGSLWGGTIYRAAEPQLHLTGPGLPAITFAISQPDPAHLILTPTTRDATPLRLTRVPLPTHYPLQERGFHFINEWGLER